MPDTTPKRGYHYPLQSPFNAMEALRYLDEIDGDVDGLESAVHPTILVADATAVTSNVLTAQVGLSRDVTSGRSYYFKIVLFVAATVNEGLKLDLAGGSATMTFLKAMALGYDGSSLALVSPVVTALATPFGPQDAFSGKIEVEGAFVPSADGTFVPRVAQVAHSSGSVQVLKGSMIFVQ